MTRAVVSGLLVAAMLPAAALAAEAVERLRPRAVPDGVGISLHQSTDRPEDFDAIAAAGFGFIRRDSVWAAIEKEKGVYDFGSTDRIMDDLRKRNLGAIWILCYSNRLYLEQPWEPESERTLVPLNTPAMRRAYADFAAAMVAHYRARGENGRIVYELWNEPNYWFFWRPEPNAAEYIALFREALPAIRKADPGAVVIAPALAYSVPGAVEFLEECLKAGLGEMVDGISVHPYRKSPPETVEDDYLRLRALIARYHPNPPGPPLVQSEWGWYVHDPDQRAVYPARQILMDLRMGLPLSVFFTLRSAKKHDPLGDGDNYDILYPDRQPRPAYWNIQRLLHELRGLEFRKVVESAPGTLCYLFAHGDRAVFVLFSTEGEKSIVFHGQNIAVSGNPIYLPVEPGNAEALAAACWSAKPGSVAVGTKENADVPPTFRVEGRNPFSHPARVVARIVTSEGVEGAFQSAGDFVAEPGATFELAWSGKLGASGPEFPTIEVEISVDGHASRQRLKFVRF